MQFLTCEVSCVLAIKAMAFKIKHVIGLSYNIVQTKCHVSRLKRFAFLDVFLVPKLAVKRVAKVPQFVILR